MSRVDTLLDMHTQVSGNSSTVSEKFSLLIRKFIYVVWMKILETLFKKTFGLERNDQISLQQPTLFRRRMTMAAVFIAGLAVVLVAVGWSFMGSVTSSNSVPVELKSTTQGLPTISAQDIGVLVHVVGGVNHPGIYQISPGSRVIDAVMAAGGIAPGASDCGINLARQVSDGEQIVISVDTACSAEKGQVHAGGALLSLNNATAEELDGLPGIGPTLAQRILEWREANGSFVDINQLNDVPGIGDKVFETLRELVSL